MSSYLQMNIPVDRRTDVEKTRDLLKQLNEEVDLEKRVPDPTRDLEERLAKLKGIERKNIKSPSVAFNYWNNRKPPV